MKLFIYPWLWMGLFIFCAPAWSSEDEIGLGPSNGGSAEAILWHQLAEEVYEIVEKNSDQFPEVNLKELRDTINIVKVEFRERITSKNDPRILTALNYPLQNLIHVSMPAWKNMISRTSRHILILHEYLGIMSIERGTYHVSRRLSRLKKAPISDNMRSIISDLGEFHLFDSNTGSAVKIRLNNDGSGLITTQVGQSRLRWNLKGNTISGQFTETVQKDIFPLLRMNAEGRLEPHQVTVVYKNFQIEAGDVLGRITYTLGTDTILVQDPNANISYDELVNLNPSILGVQQSRDENLTFRRDLDTLSWKKIAGKEFVVPHNSLNTHIHLRFLEDGIGEVVNQTIETTHTHFRWSLSLDKKNLSIIFPNLEKLEIRKMTRSQIFKVIVTHHLFENHGFDQQFAISKMTQKKKEEIALPDLTTWMGNYASSNHFFSGKETTVYKFLADGHGGFSYRSEDGSILFNPWFWTIKGGKVIAIRFRTAEGIPESSIERTQQCGIEWLDNTEEQCLIFQWRSYEIFQKNENETILLRIMKNYQHKQLATEWGVPFNPEGNMGDNVVTYSNLSIWKFRKISETESKQFEQGLK